MLWFILKSSFNNEKVPCIHLLIRNSQFVIDFKEKSRVCYSFFAKQSTIIETGSNLFTQILRGTNNFFNTRSFTMEMTKSPLSCYKFVTKQYANHFI